MLGLTWQAVKVYIDNTLKVEAVSGVFVVRASDMSLKAQIETSEGRTIPFATTVDAGTLDTLRAMVRAFEKREKPDAINAAVLTIDWAKGKAWSAILFERNGEKLQYNEQHNF